MRSINQPGSQKDSTHPSGPGGYEEQQAAKSRLQKILGTGDRIGTTALGFLGAAGAYLEEIPVLGPLVVAPLAYTGDRIRQGYMDTRAQIEVRKALKDETYVPKAAKKGLSREERGQVEDLARGGATA